MEPTASSIQYPNGPNVTWEPEPFLSLTLSKERLWTDGEEMEVKRRRRKAAKRRPEPR